jgi:hypothetical protein
VLLLCWALSLAGIQVPDPVQLAMGTLLPVAAGYFKTERKRGRHAGN